MAEAGWPLRTETFYYSHRKGGPQVLPVDVPAFVRSLLPKRAGELEPGHPPRHDPRGRLGPRAHAALRGPAREGGLEARGAVLRLRLRRASRRRDRARDADAGPRRRRVETVADGRHTDHEVRRRREPRQGERPRPPHALAPHAGRRSDRHHRPGRRGRARGLQAWAAAPADPKYSFAFSPKTQALQTKLRRVWSQTKLPSPE
jgi:hypothetical protein